MKRIITIVLSCVLLLSVFTGCSKHDDSSTVKKSVLIEKSNNSTYFSHSTTTFPDKFHVSKASVFNNELFYTGYIKNADNIINVSELNEQYQVTDTFGLDIPDLVYLYTSVMDNETGMYYLVYSDANEYVKLVKYNIKIQKAEKTVTLVNTPSSIWIGKNNTLFMSYSSYSNSDNIIEKYSDDLSDFETITLTGLPEYDYIGGFRYIDDADVYGCIIYSDAPHFVLLNDNFELRYINDISLNIENFGFTVKDDSSIYIYESTSETELEFYEISLESGETKESFSVNADPDSVVYDSFGDYDIIMNTYEGVKGFTKDKENFESVFESDNKYIENIMFSDDKMYLCYTNTNEYDDKVYVLKEDSDSCSTNLTYGNYKLLDLFIDNNSVFYFLYEDTEKMTYNIEKKDIDNNIIEKLEFGSQTESLIGISVNDNLCAISENLNGGTLFLYKYSSGKMEQISIKPSGDLAVGGIDQFWSYKEDKYFTIDGTIYKISADNTVSPLVEMGNDSITFIHGFNESDLFFMNGDGIYRYCTSENKIYEISLWDNCDYYVQNKNMVYVTSESEFYVIGTDLSNDTTTIYKYYKTDESADQIKGKTEITIAGVFDNANIGSEDIISYLKNYNNTFEKVKIKLVNYSSSEEIQKALVAGNHPDIMFMNYDELWASKILTDLKPYFEKNNLNSDDFYLNLFERNGSIKTISDSVVLNTLMVNRKTSGNTDFNNLEDFLEFINNNKNAMISDNLENMMSYLFIDNLNAYIDLSNNSVDIANKTTYEIMDQLRNLYSKDNSGNNDIINDDFLFIPGGIDSPDTLGMIAQYYNDKYVFKGIPSSKKCSPIVKYVYCFGILENSKNKDEAWNVIASVLSDEYQKNTANVPVKRSVFRERAELNKSKMLTDKDIDEIEKLIENASVTRFSDYHLQNSLMTDIESFIYDNKSAEETAKSMQEKVKRYLDELN